MKFFLFPLSFLYGLIVSIRNKLFDFKFIHSEDFNIPIISIGNITIGGTGKTPHIEYLASLLKQEFNIATLSRGYKRKTKGFYLAKHNSSVKEIGDEPKQIKHKFPNIEVAVDANRVRGIKILLSENIKTDIKVILLDDAYQHRYVASGLSILLIDYNRPITKDYLLPVGRLRESAHEMRRANIILITKSPENLKPIERRIIVKELKPFPYQTLFFTYFEYGDFYHLFNNKIISNNDFQKTPQNIVLLTGIAQTKILEEYLTKTHKIIEHLKYKDHHNYSEKNVQEIISCYNKHQNQNTIIITTEKDAMRLMESDNPEFQKLPIFYITLEVKFLNEDQENFNKLITNYIVNNKKTKVINSI